MLNKRQSLTILDPGQAKDLQFCGGVGAGWGWGWGRERLVVVKQGNMYKNKRPLKSEWQRSSEQGHTKRHWAEDDTGFNVPLRGRRTRRVRGRQGRAHTNLPQLNAVRGAGACTSACRLRNPNPVDEPRIEISS